MCFFAMDANKALGMDGFNVEFYKSAWSIIGSNVTNAVQYFFQSNSMSRSINCTYVYVVPKVPTTCFMKAYRPIACCFVLYKIFPRF